MNLRRLKAERLVDRLLGEAFRAERPEDWEKQAQGQLRSATKTFDVDGIKYNLNINADQSKSLIDVNFWPDDFESAWRNDRALTKARHPMQVLSIVAHSIADYARVFRPKYMKFESYGGREDVYDKMLRYQDNFGVKIKRLSQNPFSGETLSPTCFIVEFEWEGT